MARIRAKDGNGMRLLGRFILSFRELKIFSNSGRTIYNLKNLRKEPKSLEVNEVSSLIVPNQSKASSYSDITDKVLCIRKFVQS